MKENEFKNIKQSNVKRETNYGGVNKKCLEYLRIVILNNFFF
jgi:hypothetical protein